MSLKGSTCVEVYEGFLAHVLLLGEVQPLPALMKTIKK